MEILDPDARQRREVFARYGLAMYHAQCVEKSLAILLSAVFNERFLSSTPKVRDELFDQALGKTLGVLFRELERKVTVPPRLRDVLQRVLSQRNWMAHDYFYERAGEILTREGRKKMIEELTKLSDEFSKLDDHLTSTYQKWAKKVGIGQEIVDEQMRRLIQRAEEDIQFLAQADD